VGYCHGELFISFDFCGHDSVVGESCVNGFIPSCPYFIFVIVARLDYSFTSEHPD
jgi:hypothetical protein